MVGNGFLPDFSFYITWRFPMDFLLIIHLIITHVHCMSTGQDAGKETKERHCSKDAYSLIAAMRQFEKKLQIQKKCTYMLVRKLNT